MRLVLLPLVALLEAGCGDGGDDEDYRDAPVPFDAAGERAAQDGAQPQDRGGGGEPDAGEDNGGGEEPDVEPDSGGDDDAGGGQDGATGQDAGGGPDGGGHDTAGPQDTGAPQDARGAPLCVGGGGCGNYTACPLTAPMVGGPCNASTMYCHYCPDPMTIDRYVCESNMWTRMANYPCTLDGGQPEASTTH